MYGILTKIGLGSLSGRGCPNSFPWADVGEGGASAPRQKAQFIVDLFLLSGFWLHSARKERGFLLHYTTQIHVISFISFSLVVAMNQPSSIWHSLSHYMVTCMGLRGIPRTVFSDGCIHTMKGIF